MTKLSEVQQGDILIADGGFTCMEAGEKVVQRNADGDLYVECDKIEHYLDGQLADDDDTLIGLAKKEA